MPAAKSDRKTKKKPRLIEHKRGKIEGLREADLSLRAIKTITSRSFDTIRRVVSPASPPQPKRRGPAPLLSERHIRLVVRTAVQGSLSTTQLKAELSLPVSARNLQRRCRLAHVLQDGEHVAAHGRAQDLGQGHAVVGGCRHYWHDLRQSARQTKRRQVGGESVMVWAAFSARGKSPLVVLTGRQNSDDYMYTVSEYLLSFAHLNYGTDFIYQQDNASIHVSHRSQEFYRDVIMWGYRKLAGV